MMAAIYVEYGEIFLIWFQGQHNILVWYVAMVLNQQLGSWACYKHRSLRQIRQRLHSSMHPIQSDYDKVTQYTNILPRPFRWWLFWQSYHVIVWYRAHQHIRSFRWGVVESENECAMFYRSCHQHCGQFDWMNHWHPWHQFGRKYDEHHWSK